MYVTLDASNILSRRLLNNEAEMAKGITHVNEGKTRSVHVIATASAKKKKKTKKKTQKKCVHKEKTIITL